MVNTPTYHLTSGGRLAVASVLAPIGTAAVALLGHSLGDAVVGVIAVYLLVLSGWVAVAGDAREPWRVFALFLLTLVASVAAIFLVGIGALWLACHNGGCFD